jgi:DNA-binding SARP family transcriptional activator
MLRTSASVEFQAAWDIRDALLAESSLWDLCLEVAMAELSPAMSLPPRLSLFGGFTLAVASRPTQLPRHARRVLAYLALMSSRTNDIDRRLLTERLWPDSPTDRSAASLRTALWRIRRESPGLVHTDRDRVSLGRDVAVDVHGFHCLVARMLSNDRDAPPEDLQFLLDAVDLLPGWDDDWLELAREQLRQKRLTSLEYAARRLSEHGRHVEAIELMLAVVAAEPLRESAHAMLIDAHIRQGNMADASYALMSFARLLWTELSVHPSPGLLNKLGLSAGRLTLMLST